MSRNAETHEYSLLIREQAIVVYKIEKIKSSLARLADSDELKNLYEERITCLTERAKMLLKSTLVEWYKL